jgi:glycosyltransferase involved in cell wall biosynthesis
MTALPLKWVLRKRAESSDMVTETFFSYIIPTIGRSSLEIAINSVLTQELTQADFEIIVVNDSGKPLPAAEWQQSPRIRIINTNRSERSFARNSGAAIAKGKYLAFLDDDDWILPGALENFWQLAKHSPTAAWLYGGIQIVDENHNILAEINSRLNGNCFAQIMGGAWAPLQSSLVLASAFFAVGGFNPLICGTEDEDLCRRIAYYGEFANTPEPVGCLYRGQTWSTSTNYLRAPEDTKYSRDLILAKPKVMQRLLSSANSSYWYGRILKICLSTVAFNLKKKRVFNAISRLFFSLAVFGYSFKNYFSPDYWSGFRADHIPETLHFVMKEHA